MGTSRSRTPSEEAWIDICVPLRRGMIHWPDNLPVRVERMLDMECGDVFTSRQSRWGRIQGRTWTRRSTWGAGGGGRDDNAVLLGSELPSGGRKVR